MIDRESESPHILVKEASKTKSSKCFIHKKKKKQNQRRSKTKKKIVMELRPRKQEGR
jgi:hypothetical protein